MSRLSILSQQRRDVRSGFYPVTATRTISTDTLGGLCKYIPESHGVLLIGFGSNNDKVEYFDITANVFIALPDLLSQKASCQCVQIDNAGGPGHGKYLIFGQSDSLVAGTSYLFFDAQDIASGCVALALQHPISTYLLKGASIGGGQVVTINANFSGSPGQTHIFQWGPSEDGSGATIVELPIVDRPSKSPQLTEMWTAPTGAANGVQAVICQGYTSSRTFIEELIGNKWVPVAGTHWHSDTDTYRARTPTQSTVHDAAMIQFGTKVYIIGGRHADSDLRRNVIVYDFAEVDYNLKVRLYIDWIPVTFRNPLYCQLDGDTMLLLHGVGHVTTPSNATMFKPANLEDANHGFTPITGALGGTNTLNDPTTYKNEIYKTSVTFNGNVAQIETDKVFIPTQPPQYFVTPK
jgi:hypothetical protein